MAQMSCEHASAAFGTSSTAEDVLAAKEAELTSEVPNLLESMNRTSDEVNMFERRAAESQERYKQLLEQWSCHYEDLRSQYGNAIDRVKPYFDAAQAFKAASDRVQAVVREFSAAASQHSQSKEELRAIERRLEFGAHKVQLDRESQDGLSRATVRVLKCRQERDRREQEYADSLREYEETKEVLEGWKLQLGESMIKRYQPCFRQLQLHQSTLAAERYRISSFSERAQTAKSVYNKALAELDRINMAVHNARRIHAKMADARQLPEESPEADPEITAAAPCEEDETEEDVHSKEAQAVFAPPEDEAKIALVKATVAPAPTSAAEGEVEDESPFS